MNTKGTFQAVVKALAYLTAVALLVVSAFNLVYFFRDNTAAEDETSAVPSVPAVVSSSTDTQAWLGWQGGTIASSSPLYAQADPDGAVLCELEQDSLAAVVERQDGMLRVRTPLATGWIAEEHFRSASDAIELPQSDFSEDAPAPMLTAADRTRLDNIAEDYGCVSVSAATIRNGEVCDTYQYGWANKSKGLEMTADTKLCTASLSKVLVGMSAASMRDLGILSLDEDISAYLGAPITNRAHPKTPITLRHLLTHTSSINEVTKYSSPRTMLMTGSSWSSTRPGTPEAWRYSNIGIGSAGLTLEYASDMTLVNFTDSFYFDALDVDASYYAPHITKPESIATLYFNGGYVSESTANQLDRFYVDKPGYNSKLYFGYLTISAQDYARLLCILLGDGSYHGTAYMSPASAEEIKTPQYKLKNFDQCLVLRRRDNCYDGRTLHYHTGNSYGTLALASFDDSTGDGVVVITTGAVPDRDEYDIYAVCGEMTDYLYSLM
ncbi:MAG: beta-lactamase family protein [Ruminococcaceae bacterium]|nr:beta-lactamase family protein [Oscillospiraceae bacterium]